jgi:MFS family permease
VLVLNASAADLGLLGAARFAPYLLFTLPAGVLADRVRRRPVLVWTNCGRALAIGLVPLAAMFGVLSIPALIAVAFIVGSLTVIFDVVYVSYLPAVVDRHDLVAANSRLQVSASVAGVGGPALGGLLIQVLSAPITLVVDAGSYAISALSLGLIRRSEHKPEPTRDGQGPIEGLREGFAWLWRHRGLRALAGVAGSYNLFDQWLSVLFVLLVIDELQLSAGVIGLVFAAGALGALAGAVAAGPVSRGVGLGRAIVLAVVLECVAMVPIGLLTGPDFLVIAALCALYFTNGLFVTMSSVHALAYRQSVAPENLLGRLVASYRFISFGTIPVGAFVGGIAGEVLGVRTAYIVGSIGLLSAAAFAFFSPLRSIRDPEVQE